MKYLSGVIFCVLAGVAHAQLPDAQPEEISPQVAAMLSNPNAGWPVGCRAITVGVWDELGKRKTHHSAAICCLFKEARDEVMIQQVCTWYIDTTPLDGEL